MPSFLLFLIPEQPDRDENGATATEYGLLVLFIAFAIVISVTAFGGGLSQAFDRLSGVLLTLDNHF